MLLLAKYSGQNRIPPQLFGNELKIFFSLKISSSTEKNDPLIIRVHATIDALKRRG